MPYTINSEYSFSYLPLFNLLESLGLNYKDLKKMAHLGDSTVLKIYSGEPVFISVLTKIALTFGVELSDVVELNYNWNYETSLKSKS